MGPKDPRPVRLQGGWDVAGTGRYTFLGVDPYRVLTAYGSTIVDESGLTSDGLDGRSLQSVGRRGSNVQ